MDALACIRYIANSLSMSSFVGNVHLVRFAGTTICRFIRLVSKVLPIEFVQQCVQQGFLNDEPSTNSL